MGIGFRVHCGPSVSTTGESDSWGESEPRSCIEFGERFYSLSMSWRFEVEWSGSWRWGSLYAEHGGF